ncbi:hypothetical protein [Rhodoferax saidenbachensis]|uniref:Uncharacterized protein n=1 Tax=Rhodoferax saidenbachensis TaxID=1484693 RepID=A0A1P8K620_9BURK|nr:hypothetical protein [Rhodoferax saidenbachensis]APW41450.1 hypothetical protein RS694_02025 [Rhodoferax saidenbachensis]
MAYAGVLVIAAINCAVLFFLAFLATGGDGSSDGVKTIWLFGYIWITLFTVVALAFCARKGRTAGAVIAVSTLPTGYFASIAAIALGAGITFLKPDSAEFTAACKSSGAQFLASPTKPVHSLAYEWGRKYPIEINYFQIAANNHVSSIETRNPRYPSGITLIENSPSAADVLVRFTYPVGKDELLNALSHQGLIGYEIAVLDQRDNRTLATLRYFTDFSNRKACAPTNGGAFSVREFVLKAIGAQ